ncbi:unnamed protein product, partial [Allacma fusca]
RRFETEVLREMCLRSNQKLKSFGPSCSAGIFSMK